MISVHKPLSGHELKRAQLVSAIAWELFRNPANESDHFVISEEELELAERLADVCFSTLDDFNDD